MNQFVAIMISMGGEWIDAFNDMHPDLMGNLDAYWSGWRDQPELASAIKSKIVL
jgi:hypothetical protein